ncbi:hypothetical protein Pmar_PMAR011920 [Perkinsus marinus ATCC 50983]|uniref:Uncharacterized protein n=1 Tax=Perkinsus marinus (strain ATCC 50983 / TXsc) TaxID=423536 RepID=C5LBP3_PERM5|nr:hypothetical protein Pmar_PMAR011920 [Perkinsus marinus ATCC 50983]EER05864.1 hypothetical protein Pmar_PMAR011920 [Perkinsus marinus ATCC 50983]|eukprot:XP_002774048.1 hypothetical protein Pmar_PMAR011920 [Perkinsus marinus ATCC 50983]
MCSRGCCRARDIRGTSSLAVNELVSQSSVTPEGLVDGSIDRFKLLQSFRYSVLRRILSIHPSPMRFSILVLAATIMTACGITERIPQEGSLLGRSLHLPNCDSCPNDCHCDTHSCHCR